MAEQQTQTQTDVTAQLHKIKFLFLNTWEQFEQLTDKDKYFYYYVMFSDGTMWTQGVRYNKFIAGKGITINGNTISISGSYAPQVPNIEKYIPATGDIIQYTGQDTTHDNMQLKNGRFYKFNGTNWIPQPVTDIELTPEQMAALKGDKGDKGDSFKYEDFTPEQLATLKGAKGDKGDTGERGADGAKGDKGDSFKYEDFTEEQLADLKGEKGDSFKYEDFTPEQLAALKGDKGDSFKYEDFTPEQLAALKGEKGDKGDSFKYEDFTEEQLAALKGGKGDKGDSFKYEDFTEEQLAALKGEKGDSFKYEDFTEEQLAALKGEKGDKGDKGDGVEYTAGYGITIENNVISISENYIPQVSNISNYVAKEGDVILYTGEDTETLKKGNFYKFENLEWKPITQNNGTTYVAGDGIKIEGNVISTTGKYTPQVSDIINYTAKEGDLIQYTGENTETFQYGKFYKYENSTWEEANNNDDSNSNSQKVTKFFSADAELEENEIAQYQGETDEENGLVNGYFYNQKSSGTYDIYISDSNKPIFYERELTYAGKATYAGKIYNKFLFYNGSRNSVLYTYNEEGDRILEGLYSPTGDFQQTLYGAKAVSGKIWNQVNIQPQQTQQTTNKFKTISLSGITDLSDLITSNQLKENDILILTDIEENKDYQYTVNGQTKTFRGNPDFDLMFRCATNNEFKPIMFSPIV